MRKVEVEGEGDVYAVETDEEKHHKICPLCGVGVLRYADTDVDFNLYLCDSCKKWVLVTRESEG